MELYNTEESYSNDEDFKPGDTVKMYDETEAIKYPCIILKKDTIEGYRADLLNNIIGFDTVDDETFIYTIYIELADGIVEVGNLEPHRLNILLNSKTFQAFEKKAYINNETLIKGDMIHALYTPRE